jgi:hypothetical protein
MIHGQDDEAVQSEEYQQINRPTSQPTKSVQ